MSAEESCESGEGEGVFARLTFTTFEAYVESGEVGLGACAVCDANLPFVFWDGLLYLQAPLGCIRKEGAAKGCPWLVYMADGASKER